MPDAVSNIERILGNLAKKYPYIIRTESFLGRNFLFLVKGYNNYQHKQTTSLDFFRDIAGFIVKEQSHTSESASVAVADTPTLGEQAFINDLKACWDQIKTLFSEHLSEEDLLTLSQTETDLGNLHALREKISTKKSEIEHTDDLYKRCELLEEIHCLQETSKINHAMFMEQKSSQVHYFPVILAEYMQEHFKSTTEKTVYLTIKKTSSLSSKAYNHFKLSLRTMRESLESAASYDEYSKLLSEALSWEDHLDPIKAYRAKTAKSRNAHFVAAQHSAYGMAKAAYAKAQTDSAAYFTMLEHEEEKLNAARHHFDKLSRYLQSQVVELSDEFPKPSAWDNIQLLVSLTVPEEKLSSVVEWIENKDFSSCMAFIRDTQVGPWERTQPTLDIKSDAWLACSLPQQFSKEEEAKLKQIKEQIEDRLSQPPKAIAGPVIRRRMIQQPDGEDDSLVELGKIASSPLLSFAVACFLENTPGKLGQVISQGNERSAFILIFNYNQNMLVIDPQGKGGAKCFLVEKRGDDISFVYLENKRYSSARLEELIPISLNTFYSGSTTPDHQLRRPAAEMSIADSLRALLTQALLGIHPRGESLIESFERVLAGMSVDKQEIMTPCLTLSQVPSVPAIEFHPKEEEQAAPVAERPRRRRTITRTGARTTSRVRGVDELAIAETGAISDQPASTASPSRRGMFSTKAGSRLSAALSEATANLGPS